MQEQEANKVLQDFVQSEALEVLSKGYPGLVGLIRDCATEVEKAVNPPPRDPDEPDIGNFLGEAEKVGDFLKQLDSYHKKIGFVWKPNVYYQAKVQNLTCTIREGAATHHYIRHGLSIMFDHDAPRKLTDAIRPLIQGINVMGLRLKPYEI